MSSSPNVLRHEDVVRLMAPTESGPGWCYVDVRTPIEFASGHIEGAFNVPFKHGSLAGLTDNPHFASTMTHCFEPTRPIIVGCHSGGRAKAAYSKLVALGYTTLGWHCDSLAGSRDHFGRQSPGWLAVGLPVTKDSHPGRSYAELLQALGVTSS